ESHSIEAGIGGDIRNLEAPAHTYLHAAILDVGGAVLIQNECLIGIQGIGSAQNFEAIRNAVSIRVGIVGIGTQHKLLQVGQAVMIRIFIGIVRIGWIKAMGAFPVIVHAVMIVVRWNNREIKGRSRISIVDQNQNMVGLCNRTKVCTRNRDQAIRT